VWQTLAPGGRCVYTTCSIFPEENEQVIKAFLESHQDVNVENA